MKKFLALLIIFIFNAVNAYAAGNCVLQAYNDDKMSVLRETTFRCTAHTDNSLSVTLTDDQMKKIGDGWLYHVVTNPVAGGTACTSDSDLGITDELNFAPYTATGHGLNLIDDISPRGKIPEDFAGKDWYYPLVRNNNLTIVITNNGVASCNTDITFISQSAE